MPKVIVVCVRDSALDAFSRPFFAPTTAIAVRSFTDEVRRPGSEMSGHRADYALFEVASFDEETGKFENLSVPRQLMRAVDVLPIGGES